MLVVVVVAIWVLRATTFGRYVLATGGNPAAARLAGVPVNQVKMAVYCISGFLAGLAGLVVVAINRSSDPHRVGEYMELDAIAAVAVGGTPLMGGRATILGTFIGGMIIQFLRFTLIAHNIPDGITRIVIAGAIVVAVLAQRQRSSSGSCGSSDGERGSPDHSPRPSGHLAGAGGERDSTAGRVHRAGRADHFRSCPLRPEFLLRLQHLRR